MSNILDNIIAYKRKEVEQRKTAKSVKGLEQSIYFERSAFSLVESLKDVNNNNIIAEFKRKSPSKGIINDTANVDEVTNAYETNGAAGLSILTDEYFFGGNMEDIIAVRDKRNIPILRKDFIVDEYQIIEAKSIGADVILLIAACLTANEVKQLSNFAASLGLEILLELHEAVELNHICSSVHLAGINNRNLKTFEVDIDNSIRLADKIGNSLPKIAESGINSGEDIVKLSNAGFDGFLIGERFMKEVSPSEAFEKFVKEYATIKTE